MKQKSWSKNALSSEKLTIIYVVLEWSVLGNCLFGLESVIKFHTRIKQIRSHECLWDFFFLILLDIQYKLVGAG